MLVTRNRTYSLGVKDPALSDALLACCLQGKNIYNGTSILTIPREGVFSGVFSEKHESASKRLLCLIGGFVKKISIRIGVKGRHFLLPTQRLLSECITHSLVILRSSLIINEHHITKENAVG